VAGPFRIPTEVLSVARTREPAVNGDVIAFARTLLLAGRLAEYLLGLGPAPEDGDSLDLEFPCGEEDIFTSSTDADWGRFIVLLTALSTCSWNAAWIRRWPSAGTSWAV